MLVKLRFYSQDVVMFHNACMNLFNRQEKVPSGIIVLADYIVSNSSEYSKKHCIKICKGGARTYFFCSETHEDMLRYADCIMSIFLSQSSQIQR